MKIDESEYKADLEVLTKFQNFSSEILRLSLLGISVFGVLLNGNFFNLNEIKLYIVLAIICFGLSAAFSLGHRFWSTSGFMCHIKFLRVDKQQIKDRRNKRYKLSAKLMASGVISIGLGAIFLVIGFIKGISNS